MFVVDFSDRVWPELFGGQPFTSDVKALENAISSVGAEGQTALYDAVYEGLERLRLGHRDKKALIIVSDGGDNASRRKYGEVLALARQSQAVIYAIGLIKESGAEEDPKILGRLCKDTGGLAFFPETAEMVTEISIRIAQDLRQQYTLGYTPEKEHQCRRVSQGTSKGFSTGPGQDASADPARLYGGWRETVCSSVQGARMISIFHPEVEHAHTIRGSLVVATSWGLMAGGILLLAYAGYVMTDASAYQAIEIRKFESPKPRVQPRMLAEGDVIGEIQVPRLGLKAIVVQGDSPRILRRAVGHVLKTALPGESGNVALAGHRDTFFRPLRQIRPGDLVTFDVPGQHFRYEVDSTRVVSLRDSRVLRTSTGRDLTLITCFPFSYVGPAPDRFIVHAREIGVLP